MNNEPLLHFSLPEESIKQALGDRSDKDVLLLKINRNNIAKLKVAELKNILNLYNDVNGLGRKHPDRISLTGNKPDLVQKVQDILYKETVRPMGPSQSKQIEYAITNKRPPPAVELPPTKKRYYYFQQ